ncbi:MAG: PQQ-binding-like beta-propeller repeat protein [Terriglobia bacterium]
MQILDARGRCRIWTLPTLILAWGLGQALPADQGPSPGAAKLAEGRRVYLQHCVGCHGADARGTDQAPGFIGNPDARKLSIPQLRKVIRDGIPNTAMPPFNLPAAQLEALAAFVHSLNLRAASSEVPGNPAAGEAFFWGKGGCGSCHMVRGKGKPIGPDLSNLGHEMAAHAIHDALLHPAAHRASGYELATVELRDGKTLRGFVRSRSNFDLRLQDLEGRLHLLQESEIAAVREETESAMPPVQASPEELEDLIAFLSRLTGVQPGASKPPSEPRNDEISFERILHPKPGDWLTYDGSLSANRYSELSQINVDNIKQVELKWIFTVPLWKQFLPDTDYYHENMKYFGLETTPLVADGVMYITGPQQVLALDALSGRKIWEYSRPRTPGLVSDASLGTNRGAAILGDKVFTATDNAHLVALNRTTGRPVWEMVMPEEPMKYGATGAPLIVKDKVIAGVSGGDWGIRGFIAAYKADTGQLAWRVWTVPAKGEPGIETWGGSEPKQGGGATWLTGSYDPETDTLFWPTGNPYPDSDDRDRPGDNLFTNCILAINPDTGKVKWYYQFTPHDVHDWDSTEPPVLVDTRYQGEDRKLLLFANRNGFFYVFDRTNGKLLLAKPFINKVTWARGIGPDGRPEILAEDNETCPETAANWNATAFSPATRLYYVMALEKCVRKLSAHAGGQDQPPEEPGKKYLRALDIESGKIVWQMPQIGPAEGKRCAGVLATAGGLLFYGDPTGDFVALNARDGRPLWHFATNGENKTSPMTYLVNGRQFIAIAVGPNILCFGLTRQD